MLFRAVRKQLESKPFLISEFSEVKKWIDDKNDWYESLYLYTEEHKRRYEEKGTLSGIRDTITNQLYFDFDSTIDIDDTFYDAAELISRLQLKGIPDSSIGVYFTGNKGVAVKVQLDSYITPQEFKNAVYELAGDLKTFDKVVNDPNRVIRIVNTKHQKSGLYKVQLSLEELECRSKEEILRLAETPRDVTNLTPTKMFVVNKKQEEKKETSIVEDINWSKKPKTLTNCRWAMQNGLFEEGLRNHVLLTLAATYKNQGWTLDHTYRILKAVAELQAKRYNIERFSDEEIYNNIINQVFGEWWNDGQGSCRTPGWMQDYCNALGEHSCKKQLVKDNPIIKIKDTFTLFDHYVNDYQNNVLTTGINSFDQKASFLVGTSSAILAPPGVGKSSLAFQILNHNSNNGINSIFYSYDMFHAAVVTRLMQKHFGNKYGNNLQQIYKNYKNPSIKNVVQDILTKEYTNVNFCFKSGQTIDELEQTIEMTENETEKKIKLVIVDYNELIVSEYSDPTAASAQVAQRLRQIANDKKVCVITLLQPSKLYSSPSDEIKSYNAAKGSSSIAQSVTLMLGCSRPGFDPLNNGNDKYFNITCLKNRNGNLFSIDLGWEGLTGKISELNDMERDELANLREKKNHDKKDDNGWDN